VKVSNKMNLYLCIEYKIYDYSRKIEKNINKIKATKFHQDEKAFLTF
jgi:hypothetical protein